MTLKGSMGLFAHFPTLKLSLFLFTVTVYNIQYDQLQQEQNVAICAPLPSATAPMQKLLMELQHLSVLLYLYSDKNPRFLPQLSIHNTLYRQNL